MATPDNSAPDPSALGASMARSMPDVTGAPEPAAPPATSTAPAPSAPAPASPEVDAKQRPFDPAKHLPKKDGRGLWMPRSPGRGKGSKNKTPSPPPSPAGTQTTEPGLFDSAPPPSSSSSAGSASPPPSHGGGAGASFIPKEEPPPPTSAQPTDTDSAPKSDAPPGPEAGADDVAAVAVDLLAEGVGLLTGAPEEADPSAKEGNRLRAVLGAYLESRGVKTRGIGAVALAFGAWLLRTVRKPKTREWAREQFPRKKGAGDVIDVEARRVSPAPAAAPAPAPAAPPPASAPSAQERGAPSYSLTLPGR